MKRLILGVFIFLVGATFAQDTRLSFSNGYVNSGKFKVTKSVTEGDSYIDVTYNFTGAYIYDQVENGKTYARIEMPDARVLDIKGEPALPYYNDLLAITSSENVSVSIVKSSYKEYSVSSTVLPAAEPFVGNETAKNISESNVYSSNSLYPNVISKIEDINEYRSVPFASVSVYPVRFNPTTKKLRCYTSVTYRLKYNSSVKPKALASSKSSLEPLMDIVANPTAIEKLADESSSSLRASYSAYDYVIVTTPAFSEAAKKMSDWKTMIGYRCTTLVNSSWSAATIKSALRNIYASHLPEYLLIIGDHEQVPGTYVTVHHDRTDSYKTCSFYTDNIYACADDNNYIEDVAKGRISATTNAQALTIVNKIINYEKNPTTASSFYNNVMLSAYFQDERSYNNGTLVRDYDGQADLKFVNTSENIKSKLINRNYNINRIYTRTKSSTYYPEKDYNGTTLASDLKGNQAIWNGTANDITNAVNNGCALAIYNGHGNPSGWANIGFNVSNAQALTNGNKLPVFLGFCCQSGTFANSVCFTEAITRNANGGGVGAMGYSSYGWTPTQDVMAEALFDKLYVSKIRPMGTLLIQSLIQMGTSSSYHEHMHKVTHYFGDPSMSPWTDVPTCLNPTITKEGSSIRVKTGGVSGCKVTICRISDMTILNTTTMSGSEGLFNVGNAPCYVTITKHNYIPYVGVVRDLYLQNMSFNEDRTVHGVNITAGKNVTSDLSQGNVYVNSGNTTLLATTSLVFKSGFIVKNGAKFTAKKQSRPCNYSGNGPRSLRYADIDHEYDDEEFEIDPEITDLDDVVSDADMIKIYPNPTDGRLYIEVSNGNIDNIVVTDITGKVFVNKTENADQSEIDLSSYPKGIYLVNIVTENDSYTKKVVLK